MNFSAIIRPPSGVTRSSPVALVGLTRIVSLSTAFSTGSFSTEAKSATHSERSSLGKVSANSFLVRNQAKCTIQWSAYHSSNDGSKPNWFGPITECVDCLHISIVSEQSVCFQEEKFSMAGLKQDTFPPLMEQPFVPYAQGKRGQGRGWVGKGDSVWTRIPCILWNSPHIDSTCRDVWAWPWDHRPQLRVNLRLVIS